MYVVIGERHGHKITGAVAGIQCVCYYARMQRTTISLPDDLAAALNREARRRGIPVSRVAREAIEARLGRTGSIKRKLPFAALGRSGHRSTARDVDKILRDEWVDARDS